MDAWKADHLVDKRVDYWDYQWAVSKGHQLAVDWDFQMAELKVCHSAAQMANQWADSLAEEWVDQKAVPTACKRAVSRAVR